MIPTPDVVRARGLVSLGLSLRASLEGREGPRATARRDEVAAWLQKDGAWDLAALPLDREVLLAPIDSLTREQLTDARWSTEHAALCAWALALAAPPPEWSYVKPEPIGRALGFLASAPVATVSLRPREELLAAFARLAAVTWARRSVALGELAENMRETGERVMRATLDEELASVGAALSEEDLENVRSEMLVLDDEERARVGTLAFVRKFAAQWLVGGRELFWEELELDESDDDLEADELRDDEP